MNGAPDPYRGSYAFRHRGIYEDPSQTVCFCAPPGASREDVERMVNAEFAPVCDWTVRDDATFDDGSPNGTVPDEPRDYCGDGRHWILGRPPIET